MVTCSSLKFLAARQRTRDMPPVGHRVLEAAAGRSPLSEDLAAFRRLDLPEALGPITNTDLSTEQPALRWRRAVLSVVRKVTTVATSRA